MYGLLNPGSIYGIIIKHEKSNHTNLLQPNNISVVNLVYIEKDNPSFVNERWL